MAYMRKDGAVVTRVQPRNVHCPRLTRRHRTTCSHANGVGRPRWAPLGRNVRRDRRACWPARSSRICRCGISQGHPVWLNRDPIAEAGGVNLYAFVLNRPTGHVDPLGLLTSLHANPCLAAELLADEAITLGSQHLGRKAAVAATAAGLSLLTGDRKESAAPGESCAINPLEDANPDQTEDDRDKGPEEFYHYTPRTLPEGAWLRHGAGLSQNPSLSAYQAMILLGIDKPTQVYPVTFPNSDVRSSYLLPSTGHPGWRIEPGWIAIRPVPPVYIGPPFPVRP
jgi:hypothetical protein